MNYADNLLADFSVLDETQKIIFLRALAHLAKADGNFDKNEGRYILEIADRWGIEPRKVVEEIEGDSEEKILNDVKQIYPRRIALELIKELFLLAHTDEKLSDEEIVFIGKCGIAMGIELEKIEQISSWVIDRIVWIEQAKVIFED